jgi:hypothetical protein
VTVTTNDPYRQAIDHWRCQSVPLLPPATDSEIDAAFSELGMPVSKDVRRLYALIGGFENDESDNLWSLWSLERITLLNRDRDTNIVWFADWLISSHMYGIRYRNHDASEIVLDHNSMDHPAEQIACDMAEFLQKYADNPESVSAWIIH